MEGIYENTEVEVLDGHDAVEAMVGAEPHHGVPFLAAIYHPECPHCHPMHDDFVRLAETVKEQKLPVSIVAVNASKFKPEEVA